MYRLVIPNREVGEVFRLQINEWFKKSIFSNTERLTAFWKAFENGDTKGIEQYLNRMMSNSNLGRVSVSLPALCLYRKGGTMEQDTEICLTVLFTRP